MDDVVCRHFGLNAPDPDLTTWKDIHVRKTKPEGEVSIAVVGKYTGLLDAYKSLSEALDHGGIANNVRVKLNWIDSQIFEGDTPLDYLEGTHGILVPGGFGERGAEGKILAAKFARERGIPYFGICFGMQMAVIEAARNMAGIPNANSTEFGETDEPVVGLMTEWLKGNSLEKRQNDGDLGGTMRLGAFDCGLAENSRVRSIYGQEEISERHRHRYEVNNNFVDQMQQAGLRIGGWSADDSLVEVVELPDHPWFVACQFHPEFTSTPRNGHPLFSGFVNAAIEYSQSVSYTHLTLPTIYSV